ncbi:MAG: hypothetical protein PUB69_05770 [Desulfovibrionaceae bacterium]|nr:hypothetical protein [Desulfovibrionaceae bacterium]
MADNAHAHCHCHCQPGYGAVHHQFNIDQLSDQSLYNQLSAFLTGPAEEPGFCLGSALGGDLLLRSSELTRFLLDWMRTNPSYTDEDQRRILGVITAVIWFGVHSTVFFDRLRDADGKVLENWWQAETLRKAMGLSDDGTMTMVPVVSPAMLRAGANAAIKRFLNGELDWDEWNWNLHLAGRIPAYIKGLEEASAHCAALWSDNEVRDHESIADAMAEMMEKDKVFDPTDPVNPFKTSDLRTNVDKVWTWIWERMREEYGLVMFAQRAQLAKWAPNGDASGFDWDTLLPLDLVSGDDGEKVPLLLRKDWPFTIGNLRAWPKGQLEGDESMQAKFSDEAAQKMTPDLGIADAGAILNASFISEKFRTAWQCGELSPEELREGITRHSLVTERIVEAIVSRMLDLYEHWYRELQLDQTLGF